MPQLKLVIHKGRVLVYLDGMKIPLSRLPDLLPIYIDKINPNSSGAIVLEGEAWYGMGDEFLPAVTQYEVSPRPAPETEEKIIKSASGNLTIKDYRDRIEVQIKYSNKKYTVSYNKGPHLPLHLSPPMLSLRVLGRMDSRFIGFITKELNDKNIREYLDKISPK